MRVNTARFFRDECHEWARVGPICQEMLEPGRRLPYSGRCALVRVYGHLQPYHHRDSTRRNTNMDFRDSVSKPFKKLKHRLKEHRRKREGGSKSDTIRGREEYDTEENETGQRSRPPPEAEGMPESGPSGEKKDGDDKRVVQVDPPTSAPSISPNDGGKLLNGTRTIFL